ncbi:MAG TPA: TRAP transporter substrate-binding protein [Gammaproteobacteria bacterium]|nr:TRAP transporter substrate-binding protein [Gammaproteobacteria bacterium]
MAAVANFGHGFMPDAPHHKAALGFKDEVEKKTEGRVKINIFHSGQLGSAREMFEGLQVGSLQITLVPGARISGFAPQMQLLDLPFLFPDTASMESILDGPIGQDLLKTMAPQKVTGVAFYIDGFKQMTANKPLHAPEDFKGLKFRTMESDIIMAQYRALGADPVAVDYAEVYNALQMGVVDGHENPIILIHDMKFHEVQKYLMLSDHAMLGGMLLYSTPWFERLSKNDQQVLMEAGRKLVLEQRKGAKAIEAANLKVIENSGTQVVRLTPEQKQALRAQMLKAHQVYSQKYGSELLQRIYKATE